MPFSKVKAIIVCYHDDLDCSLVLHRKDAQASVWFMLLCLLSTERDAY